MILSVWMRSARRAIAQPTLVGSTATPRSSVALPGSRWSAAGSPVVCGVCVLKERRVTTEAVRGLGSSLGCGMCSLEERRATTEASPGLSSPVGFPPSK